MYGVMVDLTGVVSAPTKLLPASSVAKFSHKRGWCFRDGETFVSKSGEKWHGDGRDHRVTFCHEDKKQVQLWLKGVQAQQKLFRASVTKGK